MGPFLKLTFHEKVRRTEKMGEEARKRKGGAIRCGGKKREREEERRRKKLRRVESSHRIAYRTAGLTPSFSLLPSLSLSCELYQLISLSFPTSLSLSSQLDRTRTRTRHDNIIPNPQSIHPSNQTHTPKKEKNQKTSTQHRNRLQNLYPTQKPQKNPKSTPATYPKHETF